MTGTDACIAVIPPDATDEEIEELLERQEQLTRQLWAPLVENREEIDRQRVKGITHWFSIN